LWTGIIGTVRMRHGRTTNNQIPWMNRPSTVS
jgi:hypothetical protein